MKAIVLGDFTEGIEVDGKDFTALALKRFAQKVSYPVFKGLPSGHAERWNYPIPFGTSCELRTGKKGELHCSY